MAERARLLLFLVLIGARPPTAAAHGGIPISETIAFRGDTLVVPTAYWGVFFGTDGGPWRWICEEAIEPNPMHLDPPPQLPSNAIWAITGDGTYHVTDYNGLLTSRDGGCDWTPAAGEIATRQVTRVIADPIDPKRAWATTAAGDAQPWNALFVSGDDGATWTPILQGDDYFHGVAISSDGQQLYVATTARAIPDGGALSPVELRVSVDRGQSWTEVALGAVDGAAAFRAAPLAVDPADRTAVYLAADVGLDEVAVRAAADGTTTSLWRVTGVVSIGFDGGDLYVAARSGVDTETKAVLDPARQGLFRSRGGAAAERVSKLSQAQCYVVHGADRYVCASDYCPDLAAVARFEPDGGTYQAVFEYSQTAGLTESCPPQSQVGQICPAIWSTYANGLGVGEPAATGCPAQCDGGACAALPQPGCGCALGGAARPAQPAILLIALALLGRRRISGGADTSAA